jgi:hypothetical protein
MKMTIFYAKIRRIRKSMGLIKTKYLYAVEEISVHELENITV